MKVKEVISVVSGCALLLLACLACGGSYGNHVSPFYSVDGKWRSNLICYGDVAWCDSAARKSCPGGRYAPISGPIYVQRKTWTEVIECR